MEPPFRPVSAGPQRRCLDNISHTLADDLVVANGAFVAVNLASCLQWLSQDGWSTAVKFLAKKNEIAGGERTKVSYRSDLNVVMADVTEPYEALRNSTCHAHEGYRVEFQRSIIRKSKRTLLTAMAQ